MVIRNMVEREFIRLLKEYPDALSERKRFIGLVNDFLCKQPLQANLLLTLYKMGIHKEIEKSELLNNAFAYRFMRRLTDEHGVSRENALKVVIIWSYCYGKCILKIPCDIQGADESVDYDAIAAEFEPTIPTFSEIGELIAKSDKLESIIEIVKADKKPYSDRGDALLFLAKLRFDNLFDNELFNKVLLKTGANDLKDFAEAVTKVTTKKKSDVLYFGVIAAKMNMKFRSHKNAG